MVDATSNKIKGDKVREKTKKAKMAKGLPFPYIETSGSIANNA